MSMNADKFAQLCLDRLQKAIGYDFAQKHHAFAALTHPSYAAEHLGQEDYQRLEFLGDAVLAILTAHALFVLYPDAEEGALTKMRADMVCQSALADCARLIHLGDCLRLGHGEEGSGGRDKDGVLSDVFESVVGAVYLDGGFDAAKTVFMPILSQNSPRPDEQNAKSQLQEVTRKLFDQDATYRVTQMGGPDHRPEFEAVAMARGKVIGIGRGVSKKLAEQAAARQAIAQLNGKEDTSCS